MERRRCIKTKVTKGKPQTGALPFCLINVAVTAHSCKMQLKSFQSQGVCFSSSQWGLHKVTDAEKS